MALLSAGSSVLHYLSHIQPVWLLVGGYTISMTIFGFFAMGVDKHRAPQGNWCHSESFLLKIAFIGGCLGILAGMQIFHHKNEKEIFMGFLVAALVLWFFIFQAVVHFFGPPPLP